MARDDYFEWLCDMVCGKRYSKSVSYRKLLRQLYDTEFRWVIPMDRNRAEDGKDLRDRYGRYFSGPCNILEMMIALAIRCEENIMDDPTIGDRTGQWFWEMIVSLGLGSMTDTRYDEEYVYSNLEIFMNREYEPNGRGGLFTTRHCRDDLRDVEIWIQMCWYLDEIS